MFLKADKYSADQLMEMDACSLSSITIEGSIEKEKIAPIKELLRTNENIQMVLVVDPGAGVCNKNHHNLDIATAFGNMKHLTVLVFSSTPLDSISALEGLKGLKTFRLSGAYKKNMDLSPLESAAEIEELELGYGLAGPKQVAFVNNLHHLRSLKVSVLDLKHLHLNSDFEELTVTNTLKNPELLSTSSPGLKSFTINYASGINSFDFIAPLKALRFLQIGYSLKLARLPQMASPAILKRLHLVSTKQFDDLDSILQFENLEELKITEPVQIPLSDFGRLKNLTHLKSVHVVFKTEAEDYLFAEMIQKNGWTIPIKRQPTN